MTALMNSGLLVSNGRACGFMIGVLSCSSKCSSTDLGTGGIGFDDGGAGCAAPAAAVAAAASCAA